MACIAVSYARSMHRRYHHERAWARNGDFDRSADPGITERQDERQEQHANQPARAAFPNQANACRQQQRIKERIAADERHDRIEERIGQFRV